MDLDEIVRPRIKAAQAPAAYAGEVSRLDGQGDAFVVIPSLSVDYEHGPAKVVAGGTLAEGQECLVIFDETRTPWLLLSA